MPLPKYRISQSGYNGTYEEERAARQLKERLLPLARAAFQKSKNDLSVKSWIGNNAHQYTYRRLVGIHIYRAENGFLTDAIYKNLPAGLGSIQGTPAQNAHDTYEEAEKFAIILITLALAAEDGLFDPEIDKREAIFDLDGMKFTFSQLDIADAEKRINGGDDFGARIFRALPAEEIHDMLIDMMKHDFGARTMAEIDWENDLPEDRREFYVHMMMFGLTKGMFRAYRSNPRIMPYSEWLASDEVRDTIKEELDSRKG